MKAYTCVSALSAPRSVAEALQQRMDKYKEAAESAKSKGDDRKARMHQRIIKVTSAKTHLNKWTAAISFIACVCVCSWLQQYQDAIKAHKAGRPVNLAELPVPPGNACLLVSSYSQISDRYSKTSLNVSHQLKNVPYNVLIKI